MPYPSVKLTILAQKPPETIFELEEENLRKKLSLKERLSLQR
jgi:sulfur transfer protein SufE